MTIVIGNADLKREPLLREVVSPVAGTRYEGLHRRQWTHLLASGGSCPMLRGGRCSIYTTRPNVCRHFPPGSSTCEMCREDDPAVLCGLADRQ